MKTLPLQGLLVLEFSQYLSGPSAGLRLADLGARVIKIERPKSGDACRQLAIKNLWVNDSSLLFHTINRNKESFAADLKDPEDLAIIKKLIEEADVVTHNFRPGIMEKVGLDYPSVKKINERIIYAEISGYGKRGPWKARPGQDLLLQSMSGLVHTSGNRNDAPVPFGIAIADIMCGSHLVQGILASLIRRQKKGVGAWIEISLMESLLDFQFELLTTYFTGKKKPERSQISNGHPLLGAPYGIYKTYKGFLAIAMVPLNRLALALECDALNAYRQEDAFSKRDEIKKVLQDFLLAHSANHWLQKLQQHNIWSIEVLDWKEMIREDAYKDLKMDQKVGTGEQQFITTRCPIRINGQRIFHDQPAPALGAHNEKIIQEFINPVS